MEPTAPAAPQAEPAAPTPEPAAVVDESFRDLDHEVIADLEKAEPANPDVPPADPGAKPDKTPEIPAAPQIDLSKFDPKVVELLSKMEPKQIAEALTGAKVPREQVHELAKRIRAYESTGLTPEKIVELRDRLLNPPVPANPKADEPQLTDEQREAREELFKSFPELKELLEERKNPKPSDYDKRIAAIEADRKAEREAREKQEAERQAEEDRKWNEANKQGGEVLFKLVEEAGIPTTNQRVFNSIMGSMLEIINTDPKMKERFYISRDMNVMKEAFKEYSDAVFSGVKRKTESSILSEKLKQANLPTRPINGGPEKPEPPKTDDRPDFRDVDEQLLNEAGA